VGRIRDVGNARCDELFSAQRGNAYRGVLNGGTALFGRDGNLVEARFGP